MKGHTEYEGYGVGRIIHDGVYKFLPVRSIVWKSIVSSSLLVLVSLW